MCRRVAAAAARPTTVSFLVIPIPVEVHDLLPRRHPVAHHLSQTCVLALRNVLVVGAGIHVDAQVDSRGLSFFGGEGNGCPVVLVLVVLKSLAQYSPDSSTSTCR